MYASVGLPLVTSYSVGEPVTPEPPPVVANWRGPYKKRRLKRWSLRHPTWYKANGTCLIVENRMIVCHPHDEWRFRAALHARR